MFKFKSNSTNKSSILNIKVLAVVFAFIIIMTCIFQAYSINCDWSISHGFHLNLSPVIETDATDANYHLSIEESSLASQPDPESDFVK